MVIRKLTRFSVSAEVIDVADLGHVVRYALSLPARTSWHPDSLLGSAEHQGITWATELLARITQSGQCLDSEVAAGLDDAAFTLLCHALHQLVRGPGQHTQALIETCDQVSEEACKRVRAHLRQQDEASSVLPIGFLVQFINRSGARAGFARTLLEDLDADEFTLADLASRFVTTGHLWDGRAELAGFNDEALVSLVGLPGLRDLCAANHCLDSANMAFNKDDATWPGRRDAGLVMLTNVLRQRLTVPPRPPSGMLRASKHGPVRQTGPRHWASQNLSARTASDARRPFCASELPSCFPAPPKGCRVTQDLQLSMKKLGLGQ